MIVGRDLTPGKQTKLRDLVDKAAGYTDSDIETQTRSMKLEILSDIDQMLGIIRQS